MLPVRHGVPDGASDDGNLRFLLVFAGFSVRQGSRPPPTILPGFHPASPLFSARCVIPATLKPDKQTARIWPIEFMGQGLRHASRGDWDGDSRQRRGLDAFKTLFS